MPDNICYTSRRKFLIASTALLGSAIPGLAQATVIRTLEGQVWVNEALADLTTPIQPGDTVTTGAKSKIIFVIGKDVYQLGAHSTLRLRWHRDNTLVKAMYLVSGLFTGAFGPGGKKIETSSASIGIRGTGVFFKVSPENTYFCTCYGHTEIITQGTDPQHQLVSATHHKAYTIKQVADRSIVSPDTMKYHTDEDLYYLESLVDRRPPASFK